MKIRKFSVEDKFEQKYYSCAVLFIDDHWCGYVEVPKDNPCFGKGYNEIDSMFEEDIHGGLTYGRSYLDGVDESEDSWWIGFDCHHFGDKYDLETLKELVSEDNPAYIRAKKLNDSMNFPGASVKTLDFCENECLKIVRELDRIKEENDK